MVLTCWNEQFASALLWRFLSQLCMSPQKSLPKLGTGLPNETWTSSKWLCVLQKSHTLSPVEYASMCSFLVVCVFLSLLISPQCCASLLMGLTETLTQLLNKPFFPLVPTAAGRIDQRGIGFPPRTPNWKKLLWSFCSPLCCIWTLCKVVFYPKLKGYEHTTSKSFWQPLCYVTQRAPCTVDEKQTFPFYPRPGAGTNLSHICCKN